MAWGIFYLLLFIKCLTKPRQEMMKLLLLTAMAVSALPVFAGRSLWGDVSPAVLPPPLTEAACNVSPMTPDEYVKIRIDASAVVSSAPSLTDKKSIRKTSIGDLAGDYVMTSVSCVGYGTPGNAVKIVPVAGTDSVVIQGFWSQSMSVKAKIDPVTSVITIPSQYLYTHPTYGPMDLSAVTANGVPVREQPIEGSVNSDGSISLSTWWCVAINSGDDKDEIVDANRATMFESPTGTMEYKSGGDVYTFGIVATQPSVNVLSIKNFANRGSTVEISLNGDRGGIIASQTVFVNSSGTWISVGNPTLNTDGQLVTFTPAIPLNKAALDNKRSVSWNEWTIYLPQKSFSGLYDYGKVNIDFDIVYPPSASEELQGTGSISDPYRIASLSDLMCLATMVNTDSDTSGELTLGGQTVKFARSLKGKYLELTADIDMSGYRFTPIGWDLTHQFAGLFDGKGHTITGLTVESNGFSGLFGVMDPEGVVKNIDFVSPRVNSTGYYYAGPVCGISYGTVENCNVASPVVEQQGQVAGGVVGVGYTVKNCHVRNGNIYSRLGFAGGVAGQISTLISGCTASATHVVSAAAESADPRYNNGACAGGVVGSLFQATAADCSFSGIVDGRSAGYSIYSGGVAGLNQLGTMERCFAVGEVLGIGSGSVSGGVAGWVSGTVRDCYSAGMVDCINSYYTGGITGRLAQMDQNIIPTVSNCYTSAQVRAENWKYDSENEMRETIGQIWTGTASKVENVYFDNQIVNFTSVKGSISNSEMTSGNPLPGFDASVWDFQTRSYPRLRNISATPAAELSASAMLMNKAGTTLANFNTDVELNPLGNTQFWFLLNGELSKKGHFAEIDGNTVKVNQEMRIGNDTIVMADEGVRIPYFIKVAPSFLQGEGTSENPYLITNKEDMMALAEATSVKGLLFADTYFRFTNDIDMGGEGVFPGISVSNVSSNKFAGHIDGAGHAIHNLVLDYVSWTTPPTENKLGVLNTSASLSNVGLIGRLGAAGSVRNLTVADDCSVQGLGTVAAICGVSAGLIENCRNYAAVTGMASSVGGIVAKLETGGIVRNCFNAGHIRTGYQGAAGIAGSGTDFVVEGCVNIGLVEALPLCSARDEKSTVFKYVGGIGGNVGGKFTIRDCVDYGHSYAYISTVGSIAGRAYGTPTLVNNMALGTVYTPDVVNLGAMAGELSASFTASGNIWDMQMLPLQAAVSKPIVGAQGVITTDLISGNAVDGYNTDLWSFDAGIYPVVKTFAAELTVVAARRAFFLLPAGQTVGNLHGNVSLPSKNGMKWSVDEGGPFSIANNTLIVPTQGKELIKGSLTVSFSDVYDKTFDLQVLPVMPLDGDGTAQSPYLLRTASDWQELASYIDATCNTLENRFVRLESDLDFTGLQMSSIASDGKTAFMGTLDGNGHVIKNFDISTNDQYFGLIGILGQSGIVKNLTVKGKINSTATHVGGLAGRSYGAFDKCVSEVELTTNKANAGGFVGMGLGGSFTDCISKAVIKTSQGTSGGFVAISTVRMKYDNCSFEGCIASTSTSTGALNYGGIVGSSFPSEFLHCVNKGYFTNTNEKANGIGGLVGMANGDKNTTEPYIFTDCHNIADITAGSKVCGLVSASVTTAGYASMTFTDCSNTGNLTSTQAAAWTAGILGQGNPGTTLIRCFNTGNITSEGSTVGGLIGSVGGVFSEKDKLILTECYNTGKVSGKTSMIGGLIASGGNLTAIERCYNTGVIEGQMNVGGIMGSNSAANMSITDTWNSGDVIATGCRVGGITGTLTAASGNAGGLVITRCFNTGDISTSCTLQGISSASANPSGYAIGGLGGISTATYTDCYNLGSVTGVSRIGGLVGDPHTNKKLHLNRCYNAGKIVAPADTCGALIGINVENAKIWDPSMIENCYWLDASCESTLPAVGVEKTLVGMCDLIPSDAFVSPEANCFPVLDTLSEVETALLYAGQPVFSGMDDVDNVTSDFKIGTPAGVTWTMLGANAKIENGDVLFLDIFNGDAVLRATIGNLVRDIDLKVDVRYSKTDIISQELEVAEEIWFTPKGVRVSRPETEDGQAYIVIVRYVDGTSRGFKLINN